MNFKKDIEEMRKNLDFLKAEEFILETIKNESYPKSHPFLEYPNTASGMALMTIIILKLFGITENVIKDLIKKCKSVELGKFNYDRYRQNINEAIFLKYILMGLFRKNQFIPEVLYQNSNIIDNVKVPEYSLLFKYIGISFLVNIEVKTLSCDSISKEIAMLDDGTQCVLPYYKDKDFIFKLEKQFPNAVILADKSCLYQLERNIYKISKKFSGKNLTPCKLFNIGVIFIDRASSIEQFHAYFFNTKFGLIKKTEFGNIDALVIMTLDAKDDMLLSNIYNSGYVQTILFNESPILIDLCEVFRLDNFMMIGNKINENVYNNSQKEYEVLKLLKRDGFLNFIPYDTPENDIQEYLNFLNGDAPRNSDINY